MSTTSIATVTKMMETLSEPMQQIVVVHLYELIVDLRDEEMWDKTFQRTQDALATAAECTRQQIEAGLATPLNLDDL